MAVLDQSLEVAAVVAAVVQPVVMGLIPQVVQRELALFTASLVQVFVTPAAALVKGASMQTQARQLQVAVVLVKTEPQIQAMAQEDRLVLLVSRVALAS
jgi:hypothetical protein